MSRRIFNDFIVFVQTFGQTSIDPAFDIRADFNADGRVDFSDFLILSLNFGRVAVDAPSFGSSTKPAISTPALSSASTDGVSMRVEELQNNGDRVVLSVSMFGTRDVKAWGFELTHDTERFEFLGARLPETHLLEKSGVDTPLLLVKPLGDGRTLLASATAGDPVSGDGKVVEAVFGVKGATERGAFRVEEGFVFDSDHRSSGLLAADKEVYITGPAQSSIFRTLGSLIRSTRFF